MGKKKKQKKKIKGDKKIHQWKKTRNIMMTIYFGLAAILMLVMILVMFGIIVSP